MDAAVDEETVDEEPVDEEKEMPKDTSSCTRAQGFVFQKALELLDGARPKIVVASHEIHEWMTKAV